jgi:hypothetical protein
MSDRNKSPSSGKSAFERGADFFALPMAGALTFFIGPQFYSFSEPFVSDYAAENFGAGWAGPAGLLWGVGAYTSTFGFSLMLVAITARLGFAKLAKLFFGS